jgi:hypothetical protein
MYTIGVDCMLTSSTSFIDHNKLIDCILRFASALSLPCLLHSLPERSHDRTICMSMLRVDLYCAIGESACQLFIYYMYMLPMGTDRECLNVPFFDSRIRRLAGQMEIYTHHYKRVSDGHA